MKILPVLQAFQHMGSGALQDASAAGALQAQPFQTQEAQAKASMATQEAADYPVDHKQTMQDQALHAAGGVMQGLLYQPELGQDVSPQLLHRAGINLNPDAALMRKAQGMFPTMPPEQALQALKTLQQKFLQHSNK